MKTRSLHCAESWNFQVGLGDSGGPEGAISFLLQADTERVHNLFIANTIFHADVVNQFSPIYVGRKPDIGGVKDGVHNRVANLRSRPRIAVIRSLQHLHFVYSKLDSAAALIHGNCTGICIWTPSAQSVSLYLNTTKPVERNDPQYTQMLPQFPTLMKAAINDANNLTWSNVIGDVAAHNAWVTALSQVCIQFCFQCAST